MMNFCLKKLQLTLILFLFDLKLLDSATHGKHLVLQLSNLIHHSSTGLGNNLSWLGVVIGFLILLH